MFSNVVNLVLDFWVPRIRSEYLGRRHSVDRVMEKEDQIEEFMMFYCNGSRLNINSTIHVLYMVLMVLIVLDYQGKRGNETSNIFGK